MIKAIWGVRARPCLSHFINLLYLSLTQPCRAGTAKEAEVKKDRHRLP